MADQCLDIGLYTGASARVIAGKYNISKQ